MSTSNRCIIFSCMLCVLIAFTTLAFNGYSFRTLKIDKPFTKMSPITNMETQLSQKREEKKTRIAYLKIPKTGSSTLACIFVKFGFQQNLKVFPNRGGVIFKEKERKSILAHHRQADIFAKHAIYDNFFFTHIVPDPVIIGMVREPIQRVISHIFYDKGIKRKKLSTDHTYLATTISKLKPYSNYSNLIAQYFGIRAKNIRDLKMNEYLQKLNKEFSLVLILEKFNESLVLMKRLLNWSFADILYGKRKINNYDTGYLNKTQITKIRSSNQLDIDIYDFFYKELNKKILHAGDDFNEEVKHFENILELASNFCTSKPLPNTTYTFASSKWDNSFSVIGGHCKTIFITDVWMMFKT